MEVAALHGQTNRVGVGLHQHVVHLNPAVIVIYRSEPVTVRLDAVENAREVLALQKGMEKKGRNSIPNYLQSKRVLHQGCGVRLRLLRADESQGLRNDESSVAVYRAVGKSVPSFAPVQ